LPKNFFSFSVVVVVLSYKINANKKEYTMETKGLINDGDYQAMRVYKWEDTIHTASAHLAITNSFGGIKPSSIFQVMEAAYQLEKTPPKNMLLVRECEELTTKIWKAEGFLEFKKPSFETLGFDRFIQGVAAELGTTYGGKNKLYLPTWGLDKTILLHELGHAISPITALHGPEWMGNYMLLLHKYGGIDIQETMKSATAYGLSYDLGKTGVKIAA
jgi:hypothetical protein